MRSAYGILGLLVFCSGRASALDCAEGDERCASAAARSDEPAALEAAPPAPEAAPPAPEAAPPAPEAAPPSEAADATVAPPEASPPPPEGRATEPPPVVYEKRRTWDEEDAPPPVIIVDPRMRPGDPPPDEIGVRPSTAHLKPRKRDRWEPRWGVSGRVQSTLGGRDVHMYGLGAGFRYRPLPHFAFEAGLDFLRGRDWQDDFREELAFSVSALLYFNPRSAFQVYLPMGLHGSGARVEIETPAGLEARRYRYLGAHLGLGGEIQLAPSVALPIELIGFVRSRTDAAARREPEFIDEDSNLATNTSSGLLLRAGLVVYF